MWAAKESRSAVDIVEGGSGAVVSGMKGGSGSVVVVVGKGSWGRGFVIRGW